MPQRPAISAPQSIGCGLIGSLTGGIAKVWCSLSEPGNAHWFLRIAFASVFLFHGIGKLSTVSDFAMMMNLPLWLAFGVASVEVIAACAVIAGGFLPAWVTRTGALLVMPVLVVAINQWHWGQWSFVATRSHPLGGMEFQTVLLMIACYLLVVGNPSRR